MKQNTMIILDGAPVSTEIWTWFHEMIPFVEKLPESIPIEVFSFLLKRGAEGEVVDDDDEDERAHWPMDYCDLDLNQFWQVFSDIFQVCIGIYIKGVPTKFTVDQIVGELTRVVEVAAKWCIMEGFTKLEFGDHDHEEIDIPAGRVSQMLRYKVYYMAKDITESATRFKKTMREEMVNHEISDMHLMTPLNTALTERDHLEFMEKLIREKSKGDLDEFVLYTIQSLQFSYMNSNHNKLAQLIRFKAFGEKDFSSKLPPCEIWRLLFPNYFDGIEDYFNRFFGRFTNECMMYFFRDYLAKDYGIVEIPMYKLFTNDKGAKCTYEVKFLIDPEKIEKDIEEIEFQYRLS